MSVFANGLAVVSLAGGARAQGADSVTAEALFQEGRDLLREGRLDAACPKLAESYRLDAATGTLMALAMCHEQQGKLTSAWAEFADAAARAKSDGRQDREEAARERAAALRPRLSSLRVELAPELTKTHGFELRRDGVPLGSATFGAAIPIDGGTYALEATAPGKQTWRATITVKAEHDQVSVRVPALHDEPAATPGDPANAAPVQAPVVEKERGFGALGWAGIGVGVLGVAAGGAGTYFLVTALDEKADTDADCDANACGAAAFETRKSMVKHGNLATAFGIGGALLAGAGVTMVLISLPGDEETKVGVSLGIGPGGVAARVKGTF